MSIGKASAGRMSIKRIMSSRAACQLRMGTLVFWPSVQNFGMPVFGIVPVCQLCQYWRASFLALRQCASCAKMLARRFSGTVPVCELCQYWHASFVALCQCASCAKILARKFLALCQCASCAKI